MYKIYAIKGATETLIYNDLTPELTGTKLISPKLSLQDNAAGSFTCKIPQGNAIYSSIEPMTTTIRITRDGVWLWTGRVLTIKKDFWLQKEITAEGALAFLNDVALPQQKWSNVTTANFVQALLTIHNAHVPTNRQILAGAISTSTSSGNPIGLRNYVSQGESPLKHISTLAEDWGLHMRIRESSGSLYLDMRTDAQLPSSTQEIDFGKNLLDYVDEMDWSDLVTVLHPLGAELETYTKTGDEEYPDKVVIDANPSSSLLARDGEYIYNKTAVNKFGRIEETVEWSEIDDAATLLKLAEMYLLDFQYYNIKLTVKVVDLHYMTSSIQGFQFLSKVYCKSSPHNLADEFIIDKMDIPFDQPEQTTFTFARSTMGYYTSNRPTQGFGKGTVSGMSLNVNTFSKAAVLKSAKQNAAQMILANTQGYVSLNMDFRGDYVENLTITNRATQENSTQRWLWSMGGLMYQERSSTSLPWSVPNVAITMDGQIVADMITTGVLQVASSSQDVLFSADMTNNTVHIAGFTVFKTKMYTGQKDTIDAVERGVYVGNDGLGVSDGVVSTSLNLAGIDFYTKSGSTTSNTGKIYGYASGGIYIQSKATIGLFAAGGIVTAKRFDPSGAVYYGMNGTFRDYNNDEHTVVNGLIVS